MSLVLLSSVAVIGGAASCGPSNSVRVRAVDTPAIQPAPVDPNTATPAPGQLPAPQTSGIAPVQPPAADAPSATLAAAPTQGARPETTPAAAPATSPTTTSSVVVAPAAPVGPAPGAPGLAVGDSSGQPATASDTTAFTSPPTTIVVRHEMPNVVCMDLQAAQNLIQKAGVFYSKSFDATGKNRHQVWDRHWIVVSQNLAPGTAFGEGDAKLGVVKDSDPNNC